MPVLSWKQCFAFERQLVVGLFLTRTTYMPFDQSFQNGPIATEKVMNDRKVFFIDLKENNRGRFLKITENVGGRRDTIMLPIPALADFIDALGRLRDFESKLDG